MSRRHFYRAAAPATDPVLAITAAELTAQLPEEPPFAQHACHDLRPLAVSRPATARNDTKRRRSAAPVPLTLCSGVSTSEAMLQHVLQIAPGAAL
jgi:hypothetical protein